MMTRLRVLIPILIVASAACASLSGGCGSKAPDLGPATVRGRLTFNGQPVAGGLVVFTPDADRGGRGKPAYAETRPDGGFQLQLDESDHIPVGWYRVSLAPAPVMPDPIRDSQTPTFPARLSRPDLSGIEREVQAGKNHDFAFAVGVE